MKVISVLAKIVAGIIAFGRGGLPDGIDCDNREHDSQDTIIHF